MEINEHNYKDVLLMRLEGELSPEEVLQAEAFILVNEAAAKEWKLLQKTVLQPTEQIFFPRKNLLMREEDEVVVAPISVAKVVEQEGVVRTIGGGFNDRKFAIPVSIAASLLLFFFFFNNKNIEVEKGNLQANNQHLNHDKAHSKLAKTRIQPTNGTKMESTNIAAAESNQNKKTADKKFTAQRNKSAISNKPEVFSTSAIYAGKSEVNKQQESGGLLAQVELDISPVKQTYNNSPKLKFKNVLSENAANSGTSDIGNEENSLAEADFEQSKGLIIKLLTFFNKTIQIEKQTEDEQDFYAFKFETEKIKIVKTFKSNF